MCLKIKKCASCFCSYFGAVVRRTQGVRDLGRRLFRRGPSASRAEMVTKLAQLRRAVRQISDKEEGRVPSLESVLQAQLEISLMCGIKRRLKFRFVVGRQATV